jgi:hypothetical protein
VLARRPRKFARPPPPPSSTMMRLCPVPCAKGGRGKSLKGDKRPSFTKREAMVLRKLEGAALAGSCAGYHDLVLLALLCVCMCVCVCAWMLCVLRVRHSREQARRSSWWSASRSR